LALRWTLVEIGLGVLVCLLASAFLAPDASDAMADVVGGLLSFILCGLLIAVPVVIAMDPSGIRKHALAWQLGWISLVLASTWLGHVVVSLIRTH
jgi:hypothetical protein